MEDQLVNRLKAASDAYYNTGTPLMTDEEYDALRDQLERLNPKHPYLNAIGALPRGTPVKLPYPMPSLQKIKPNTGTVEKFATQGPGRFVLSDKLDGLSALWVSSKKMLYLRGDGELGVEISSFVPYIQGLVTTSACVVRGELITEGESRSWVNGVLHQKEISPSDAKRIHFVAYELLEPKGLSRSAQFASLSACGFEVPWTEVLPASSLNETTLAERFRHRRQVSSYSIDGIVVGEDRIPLSQVDPSSALSNPKDCVAFKMVLSDQCAETTVRAILWAASHQGYLIPRLQVDPVQVQDCQIEFLTGHNAKFLKEKRIGLGAKLRIRRSGDVIPTVDTVLVPSDTLPFPSKYVWDSTLTHIVLPTEALQDSVEIKSAKLLHFASTLDVAHLGPGLVKKLVEAGYTTPKALQSMTPEQWQTVLGKGMGEKVRKSFEEKLKAVDELTLMVASSTLPRGTGTTKLKALFEREPDWQKWSMIQLAGVKQWSLTSLQECLTALESYKKWRSEQLGSSPVRESAPPPVVSSSSSQAPTIFVCFTGFRSGDLEAKCLAKNIQVQPSVTKQTTVLVTSSSVDSTSGKVKKAKDLQTVRILDRLQFEKEYLGQA